ncbi:MAG TPA: twin-arginine translocase subunit TatC [Cyclobacteriaceae bacterium]|jgi:sec-independent protein translocase protein TatC|nr:twin-arginine translocase subunit TatC [Cytophagales bacterium]HNT49032.1 twin-arginine translocase subunit TatC [Cyclobacteriaceae bacterium]HRE68563.1 twin-arginine translocase subunit TatC [Cyclobacteriaceae bacterium]HRF35208.1 twin-arginine translocase subunit TatC [Cyclobacteriaceae bacterium]
MAEEKEMAFLDHLEELRWHVVRSVAAIFIMMILAFVFTGFIFDEIIFAPSEPTFITFRWLCRLGEITGVDGLCVTEIPMKLQSRFLMGQFTMQLTSSFVIGLCVAFPYVVWELWRFVSPGLYNREKKGSRGAVFYVSFLFLLGIAFGYFILSPMTIAFLANYTISDKIANEFDITSYVSTITALVLGSGLLFQLPVVIFFLTKVGIVTPKFLRHYRKHAVVIILITGAIITPSPDPLSQSLISVPLYILYEISIWISAMELRRKEKRELAELQNSAT